MFLEKVLIDSPVLITLSQCMQDALLSTSVTQKKLKLMYYKNNKIGNCAIDVGQKKGGCHKQSSDFKRSPCVPFTQNLSL